MGDRLKDKVALVSGAGSSGLGWGNGKATAVLFAREGAKVLAADLNLDAAIETKRIIESEGGICMAVVGDVSRTDDVVPENQVRTRLAGGGSSHERTRLCRPNSLLYRENTGNFIGFGLRHPNRTPKPLL
jgi:hypothetical protein